MAERYLIDTSAAIKYLNGSFTAGGLTFLDEALNKESLISFISEIELQVWNPANPDDVEVYQEFVAGSFVFGVDNGVVAEAIRIRKTYRLKLPDALIAATAISNNLTLIADNDKDFLKVPALKYVNPGHLATGQS